MDAANAFLATLSPHSSGRSPRSRSRPQNAARWSNFPAAVVPRNGVYFRDMTPAQTAAALKVARLALSARASPGSRRSAPPTTPSPRSTRPRRRPGRGGPGGPPPGGPAPGRRPPGGSRRAAATGGPGSLFGHGNYIIAFLGKPSKTTPWLLQLGGHHLAFNIYYKGTAGAATPYFVGAQPNIWKDAHGKTHAPLAPMRDAMYGLIHSLTPEQQAQARLDASFSDVYVGPGRDGQFPARSEGVPVSELSAASKNWSGRRLPPGRATPPRAPRTEALRRRTEPDEGRLVRHDGPERGGRLCAHRRAARLDRVLLPGQRPLPHDLARPGDRLRRGVLLLRTHRCDDCSWHSCFWR